MRLHAAVQCFKRQQLGEAHDPQVLQYRLLTQTLKERGVELVGRLSEGTLENWWRGAVQRANEQSCQAFDQASVRTLKVMRHSDGQEFAPEPDFFFALMRGGLLRWICDRVKPKGGYERLLACANAYVPVGSLHLQMDALDAMRLDPQDLSVN